MLFGRRSFSCLLVRSLLHSFAHSFERTAALLFSAMLPIFHQTSSSMPFSRIQSYVQVHDILSYSKIIIIINELSCDIRICCWPISMKYVCCSCCCCCRRYFLVVWYFFYILFELFVSFSVFLSLSMVRFTFVFLPHLYLCDDKTITPDRNTMPLRSHIALDFDFVYVIPLRLRLRM